MRIAPSTDCEEKLQDHLLVAVAQKIMHSMTQRPNCIQLDPALAFRL